MSLSFPYIWVKSGGLPVDIVSFAEGTEEQLGNMLFASDHGLIDINDYWSVGDERQIHLSSCTSRYQWPAMDEQDVTLVIWNRGYNNQEGIHFVVGQKRKLKKNVPYVQEGTAEDSLTSWMGTDIAYRLGDVYRYMLPQKFQDLLKPFSVISASSNSSSSAGIRTDNNRYVTLPASQEIYGSGYRPIFAESNALSQFDYFKTASNRQDFNAARMGTRTISYEKYSGQSYNHAALFNYCSPDGPDNTRVPNRPIAPMICI